MARPVPRPGFRKSSGLDAPPFPGCCCCGDQGRPEITAEIIPANTANGTNDSSSAGCAYTFPHESVRFANH